MSKNAHFGNFEISLEIRNWILEIAESTVNKTLKTNRFLT